MATPRIPTVTPETAERIVRTGWGERSDAYLGLPLANTVLALYEERDRLRAEIAGISA